MILTKPAELAFPLPGLRMAVAYEQVDGVPYPDRPVGLFALYVCRRCGIARWFVENPRSIPVGAEHETFHVTVDDRTGSE